MRGCGGEVMLNMVMAESHKAQNKSKKPKASEVQADFKK